MLLASVTDIITALAHRASTGANLFTEHMLHAGKKSVHH